MQDLIATLTSSEAGAWFAALAVLVTAANSITALTPTKSDDKILSTILGVLNFISLNVYKNKNADGD
jgi:hypothetical protein|tara:strand:+ start:616 stop:816 length:201 start_codon:yes stop_codon:yes gene_type:complete